MTTRVHIVNFGPDAVDVKLKNPKEPGVPMNEVPSLFAQQSVDVYVHDTQAVEVTEKTKS